MTNTRTEAAITADLEAARKSYHDIVDTGNRHDVAAAAARIPELQQELCEALAADATDCPECQVAPIGVLKTPEIVDNDGNLKSGAVYEVGCLKCMRRARGSTAEKTVVRWNAGQYVLKPKMADGEPVLDGEGKAVMVPG